MLYCFTYLSIAFALAVAYSEVSGTEWAAHSGLQQQKVNRLIARANNDEFPILQTRGPKKKPKPFQGSLSNPDLQRVKESPSASQGSSKSQRGKISSPGSSDGSPAAPAHPDSASDVTSRLSSLRLASTADSGPSSSQAQANIGRGRSPDQGRSQDIEPESKSWDVGPYKKKVTFSQWLENGQQQVAIAKAKAEDKPGGGRAALRAAKKPLEKAAAAKKNYNDLRADMKRQYGEALPIMANTKLPKPDPRHPSHKLAYKAAETGVKLANAGMAYDEAERNVAEALAQKNHWSEVPNHLQRSYRITAKTKAGFARSEAFGHKWNTFVGEEEAKSQQRGTPLRAKTDKEVELAKDIYASKARQYKKFVGENRQVRNTFSGSDSSDSETSAFDEAL